MASNWKISVKLLCLNILVFLVLAGILAVVLVSFRQTQQTITTITQRDVTGIIKNAQTGRELTSIFADLLTSIFYGDKDAGQAGLQRLDRMIQSLTGQAASRQLQQALQTFAQKLTTLLEQSANLKTLALKFSEKEEEFLFNLEMLNDVMKEKIDKSKDQEPNLFKHLEQLQATILGFRGAFNQIIRQATELQRGKALSAEAAPGATPPRLPVLESLDYLLLRFQALNTTDDQEILESGKQLTENVKQYQAIILQYQDATRTFQTLFQEANRSKDIVIAALNDQEAGIAQTVQQMEVALESENQRFSRLIAVLAGILGMVIVFSSYLVQKMVKPLAQLTGVANALAAGDLTGEIPANRSQDEIGALARAFGEMQAKISEVAREVKTAAQDVAQRSREMSVAAEQMSEGVSQQAAATEEVSASMEEMAANIRQTADNARLTEGMAIKSAEDAHAGKAAVMQIIQAMEVIADRISVIQEIASQTNILSLNATIEAAKAEEYGKGFTVVAASVRELARESRSAADEIRTLVHSCVVLSAQAGEVLQRLVPNSEKTAELVQEISAASQEQSTGVDHVNQAVQQLDTVTQHNAATSEQVAATAETLTTQADALQQTMAFFTVNAVQPVIQTKEQEADLLQRLQGIEKERLVALLTAALSDPPRAPGATIGRPQSQTPKPSDPPKPAQGMTVQLSPPTAATDEQDQEFERY